MVKLSRVQEVSQNANIQDTCHIYINELNSAKTHSYRNQAIVTYMN